VTGALGESVVDQIRKVAGIESVDSSKDRYRPTLGAFRAVRWIARLLVAGLALALLTGLMHLARMNAHLHRETFALLRLWGAGTWELRAPGLISGVLVGALGGACAGAIWIGAAPWIGEQIRALSPIMHLIAPPAAQLGASLMALGAGLGFL